MKITDNLLNNQNYIFSKKEQKRVLLGFASYILDGKYKTKKYVINNIFIGKEKRTKSVLLNGFVGLWMLGMWYAFLPVGVFIFSLLIILLFLAYIFYLKKDRTKKYMLYKKNVNPPVEISSRFVCTETYRFENELYVLLHEGFFLNSKNK